MQRNNAKEDAVEGGEDGERSPSSQPIAPAVAGQSPPQPAVKSIAYFTEGREDASQDGEERPNAVWPSGLGRPSDLGRIREKPDNPLTPLELFQRGIEMTREIHGRIIGARAYYLGRPARAPALPLSEVFDPIRGPILNYFAPSVSEGNLAEGEPEVMARPKVAAEGGR